MPNSEQLIRLERELEGFERCRNRPSFLKALGVGRTEVKHSNFIAFLLNPVEKHGLSDRFLKQFLEEVEVRVGPLLKTRSRLFELNLGDTEVLREKDNIDILLLNRPHRFAIIIENKTGTGEHDEQLQRYWAESARLYPWAKDRLVGILLTAKETRPTDTRYVAVSYAAVCGAGEKLLRTTGNRMPAQTRQSLAEYISGIRREFVGDPNILDLTWKINLRFREAMDFLRNNTPNVFIHQKLSQLVRHTHGLQEERGDKYEVSFSLEEWSRSASLRNRKESERYNSRLLFWFRLTDESIDLLLSPDPNAREVEDRLLGQFARRPDVFRTRDILERDGWKVVWSRRFVTRQDLDSKSREEIMKQLGDRWRFFLTRDLPLLRAALAQEFLQ
jgi:arsenate reductase-like glutaredoxin family protein